MSSYQFSPQQFICTKTPEEMEDWVNRHGKSQADEAGVMKYEDYPEIQKNCILKKSKKTSKRQRYTLKNFRRIVHLLK